MRRFLIVLGVMVMIPYVTTMAWTGKVETAGGKILENTGGNSVGISESAGLIGSLIAGRNAAVSKEEPTVIVMRNGAETVIKVEEFLIHVLAAQIPVEFGPETLKAQAVLARTYVYSVMNGGSQVYEEELDMDALSLEQMKKLWGESSFAEGYGKLQTAVNETRGMYLLYDGAFIEPLYCYASAGQIRSGGDEYPYLKQVESAGDLLAEGYRSLPVFELREFCEKINEIPGAVAVSVAELADGSGIQIVERDGAGYVLQVQIGQKTYTGEEVQYALGLASPCYSFERLDGKIRVICKGIGHGYGFSQFGANEMEKEGKKFQELLNYYFRNVEIVGRE